MSSVLPKSWMERAADGCHKFNWLINSVVIIATVSFATGKMDTKVEMIQEQQVAIQHRLSEITDQAMKIDERLRLLERELARVQGILRLEATVK